MAAGLRVLKLLSERLSRTATDIEASVLNVSSGFSGMAQKARAAVEQSQCRIQSQQAMNEVLDNAEQTLTRVDTIAKEARIVGLNGQIEAARAGQHGVAFAIVANETKSLAFHAADTSDSFKKVLQELSQLHSGLVDALQSSEHAGQELSGEIAKAVIGMQFQDRINQQLQHVAETLDALRDCIAPALSHVDSRLVESRTSEWHEWLQSRTTMNSERDTLDPTLQGGSFNESSQAGSVELF